MYIHRHSTPEKTIWHVKIANVVLILCSSHRKFGKGFRCSSTGINGTQTRHCITFKLIKFYIIFTKISTEEIKRGLLSSGWNVITSTKSAFVSRMAARSRGNIVFFPFCLYIHGDKLNANVFKWNFEKSKKGPSFPRQMFTCWGKKAGNWNELFKLFRMKKTDGWKFQ